MSVKSKMTAIADKIRTLLGITGDMGMDAMASNIGKAQEEVDDQAALIEQLRTTLAGKAGGGIIPSGTVTLSENGVYDVKQYASAVVDVPSKAPVLQEKTVSPSTSGNVVTPDSGYDGLSKVNVNAVKTAAQAVPGISVSSNGLITASATQTEGYVSSGTKSATKQLTTQAAQTITPGTTDKTIASGKYLTGIQTIKGDANLVAGNIKKGVSIFGITGALEAMPGKIKAFKSGSFVPDKNYSSETYTVQHGLGVTPNFAIVWATDYSGVYSNNMMTGLVSLNKGIYSEWRVYEYRNSSNSETFAFENPSLSGNTSFNANTFDIKPSSSMRLDSEVTYNWIVANLDIE